MSRSPIIDGERRPPLAAPAPGTGMLFRWSSAPKRGPVRTFSPKPADIQRAWHVVDADRLVLGRMATEVARVLRGKHKPIYAPHVDTGDHVVIVNAAKVVVTSDKADKKVIYRHSGYPGGLKTERFRDAFAKKPEEAVRRAVRGMLPKGP